MECLVSLMFVLVKLCFLYKMKLKKWGGKKIHREQITLRINISQRMQGGKRLQKWKFFHNSRQVQRWILQAVVSSMFMVCF